MALSQSSWYVVGLLNSVHAIIAKWGIISHKACPSFIKRMITGCGSLLGGRSFSSRVRKREVISTSSTTRFLVQEQLLKIFFQ